MTARQRNARARTEAGVSRPLAAGVESEFRIDLERIRFAPAFSRLAEVTQVVTSGATAGVVHNRLTHSIKVTAVARAIAVGLLHKHPQDLLDELGGLNHVVCQAAGVAHDLGHPPFGHLGERVLDRLGRTRFGLIDGFEGNAQTFRILTELEVHGAGDEGLNLTAAVRAAVLKYPWGRFQVPSPHPSTWDERPRGVGSALPSEDPDTPNAGPGANKFSAYTTDLAEMVSVLDVFANLGPGRQTLECSVMDVADDIAYSLHDLEDFHRSGVLQFSAISAEFRCWQRDRLALAAMDTADLAQSGRQAGAGLERLRRRLEDRDGWIHTEDLFCAAVEAVREEFVDGVLAMPYDGSMAADRSLSGFVTSWIDRFISSVSLNPHPHLRSSWVELDPSTWHEVSVLKFVHQYFVLNRPDLAMLQRGQAHALTQIVEAFDDWLGDRHEAVRAPRRLQDLVTAATYGFEETGRDNPHWLGRLADYDVERMGRGRGILDYISSLTDEQALSYASRLRGTGAVLWSGGEL